MPKEYPGDRGQPTTPASSYTLLFDAHYLKLRTLGGSVVQAWHARSGRPTSGLFDYSASRQRMEGQGPIPEGKYWVRPDQIDAKPKAWEIYRASWAETGWGNYRVIIHPYPGTMTFGRGGMFIHGGAVWGSAGCVDLTYGIDSFVAKLGNLRNCHIPLEVAYNGTTTLPPP